MQDAVNLGFADGWFFTPVDSFFEQVGFKMPDPVLACVHGDGISVDDLEE